MAENKMRHRMTQLRACVKDKVRQRWRTTWSRISVKMDDSLLVELDKYDYGIVDSGNNELRMRKQIE